jgi:hypothetical protein
LDHFESVEYASCADIPIYEYETCLSSFKWSYRRDLNPRPSDYKSDALPTELL